MKFLVSLDLSQLELKNARMQNLAAAPGTPVVGQMYFNTATNKFGMYYSAAWKYFSVEGHTHVIADITDWPASVDMTEVGYLNGVTSAIQTQLNAKAALASPTFTGDPKAPTPATGDNDTSIATTAFVKAQAYAPLASPALTGTPTAPTAAPGTNTTQLSTTAFVQAAIAALINGSPGALDTLKELADAMGDDPNFATTITNSLAGKQPLNSILTAIAALNSASPNGGNGYLVIDRLSDAIRLSFPQGASGIDTSTFDGNNNPIIKLTDVVAASTYTKVTVNAQGRVTAGAALVAGDIPNLSWSKITSGKPTTLAGYGITDAVNTTDLGAANGVATLDGNSALTLSQARGLTELKRFNFNGNGVATVFSTPCSSAPVVKVYEVTAAGQDFNEVVCDIEYLPNDTEVDIIFAVAPANGSAYTAVIIY